MFKTYLIGITTLLFLVACSGNSKFQSKASVKIAPTPIKGENALPAPQQETPQSHDPNQENLPKHHPKTTDIVILKKYS